ncbi:recombinase family protein [Burkholderia multivorans]|uniref:recombinase family protein n=4 Tax=Burkholderia multivorans TaxID=87883 RepID=UPI000DAB6AE0|nr:recombinase family protein [Burkholderia multivorans]RAE57402.1 recombinase family protein [Burkholderia multivorans]RAF20367.1 recombinase family protein [Burkholderia multivorans]
MSTGSENHSDTLFGQTLGYVRVSSADQNPGRQYEIIGSCDKVFEDKLSGKSRANRTGLTNLIDYARDGDHIRIASLDRLGRDTRDLYSLVDTLTNKGCTITFVSEGITVSKDGSSPMQELFITFLSGMAQFERARILERQREGIELAKARGIYQRKLTDEDVEACRAMVDMGISVAEVARRYEVSRQTVYNALNKSGAYSPAE